MESKTRMQSDIDPIETREWLDAFASVMRAEGKGRAQFILNQLLQAAHQQQLELSQLLATPYCNTIPVAQQPAYPGNLEMEQRIEALNRWNAIAMVLRAKKNAGGVGGHLSSYASIATLYEVGLQHFFRGVDKQQLGDLVYFQGHSSEGIYARAFLEGRLTEEHLKNFRQEVDGTGVSSYPHPWLMPNFWQFATVSLGLGALQGVYQARFMRYVEHRQLLPHSDRKVWVFCGDGEMDEPESIAGLTLAAREKLDNLVFVVNCNLQRLDGLVRSNGKIVQELEGLFRGAGWHVIKVMWGSKWDEVFAADKEGVLLHRLNTCVDGDLQDAYAQGGVYRREFLAGDNEELRVLLASFSDTEIAELVRGAHDPVKVYAAYTAASQYRGQPTVILAQGVKGYGLGTKSAEGRNVAHNLLDMTPEDLKIFRERFKLPLSDQQLLSLEFYKPAEDSQEIQYLHAQRKKLGGYLPARHSIAKPLTVPDLSAFDSILKGSADRPISTTMVLGRIFNILLKDEQTGPRIVPIFSDEVRTFGLESLFRQIGIYSSVGQLYTPEDKGQFLYYRETQDGQVLEEGITEAGCMCSWIAAATSYVTHQLPMIPIFTYYSMFGFQRVGDLIWAAGDMRARGFLIGATAGRTTLEGEGLQHQDGQSLLVASTVPNCRAYDPAFGYEMAVIMQDGLHRMYQQQEDVFYYCTAMNERYVQPEMPKGVETGIVRGMYLFQGAKPKEKTQHVQLLGSGAILNEVIAAAALLAKDFAVTANIWSVTSFSELRRQALAVQRENMLSPEKTPQLSYVEQLLEKQIGPVIAATDYVRAYADLIRPFVHGTYITLGTDGFGRSDTREKLRWYFEVNRYYIAVATLYALMKEGKVTAKQVTAAIKKYKIDPRKVDPVQG
ncbi:MAG: pyruvate dehydrogenase (acetyl-transferring), homodimeric type [Gammaproteobacteria bacterium RIFCSPHIGHO2_12_FULL_41_20]|nr:MAG: pyruvate dehydrogenase (acetyl-transferring), homodimeric type [Gammaproteobacteria bacterium RIFCSPHIGHO2_12_FULL_41_20]